MNSLSALNAFSLTPITFNDPRESQVTFSPDSPVTKLWSNSSPIPVGTNVTNIINAENLYNNFTDSYSSTTGLTYKITLFESGSMPSNSDEVEDIAIRVKFTSANLFSASSHSMYLGNTIGSGNLVTRCDVNNSGPGVFNYKDYYIEGIKTVGDWNIVRSPYVIGPPPITKCTISGNNVSKSWFIFGSTPYYLTNNGNASYTANIGAQVVANIPTVGLVSNISSSGYLDVAGIRWLATDELTYTITPLDPNGVTNITAGSGNTSAYTNSVSLTGNINQISGMLHSNISITPLSGYTSPIILTHSLVNANSNVSVSFSTTQNIVTSSNPYITEIYPVTYSTPTSGNISINFNQSNLTSPLALDRSGTYQLDMAVLHWHHYSGSFVRQGPWTGSLSFTGMSGPYNVLGTVDTTADLPSSGSFNDAYIVRTLVSGYPSLYYHTAPHDDLVTTAGDTEIQNAILNVTSTGTGGTAGWELYNSKTYSIRGSISDINSHLQSMTLTLSNSATTDYVIRWSLINRNVTPTTTLITKQQTLNHTS